MQRIPVERPDALAGPVTLTVGVDVGGTSVRAGVVNGDGAVLDTARTPTPRSETALEAAVAGVVEHARGQAPDRRRRAGAGRVHHARPAGGAVRAAPVVAGRPGGRPDRGPHRAARRRRARRQRGRAGRAALRRGVRCRHRRVRGVGHRHRLGAAAGRRALPGRVRRGPRAGASAGGAGRAAVPVREDRLLGALLLGNGPRHDRRRAAGARSGSTRRCCRGWPRATPAA